MKLIFNYVKENRASFNALAGAIEAAKIPGLEMLFPESEAELEKAARHSIAAGYKTAIGMSFFTSQHYAAARTLNRLQELFGNKFISIAGGPHPSGAPHEVKAMGFDYVIAGEGEEALIKLCRELVAPATAARPGRGIICGRKLADLDKYPPFSFQHEKIGAIEITRGCPFGCTYCQTSYLFGGKPRHRSVENVLRTVRQMHAYGYSDIRFLTPDAFAYGSVDGRRLNIAALEELLSGARDIIERKGKMFFGSFPSEVRPEHVTKKTLELTSRYADNKRLVIGAQTGSPRLLKLIRRQHTVSDIYKGVELAIEYGFNTDVDFIFGLPEETETDAKLTIALIERLIPLGARIHTHTFMPLVQTPLESKTAAPISPRTEKFIKTITSRGHAFGQWEKQRAMR